MQPIVFTGKQRFGTGFLGGLGAGVIASVVMILLSNILSGISLPEVVGGVITNLMPLSTFDYLHRVLGADAKYYLFVLIFLGQCLVFALCGAACSLIVGGAHFQRWRDEQEQLDWRVGAVLAGILWVLTGLVFLPLMQAGIFGSGLEIGVGNTMFSLAVVGIIFGLLYVLFQNRLVLRLLRKQGKLDADMVEAANYSRRAIVRTGGAIIGLSLLGALAWRFITSTAGGGGSRVGRQIGPSSVQIRNFRSKITPPPTPNYGTVSPVDGLSSEVTSNTDFYVVSKNLLSDPSVNGSSWQLNVRGSVQKPYSLTYDQLTALPMKQQYESMMCISNEVGGEYMSNALWEGVPLADLLNRAGIKPGASKVVLHAADDYSDSIHLTKALEPTTLIAVRMNGVQLPKGHGYPARLLVPGIYGMKHVKWITAIEVVDTDYQGYWQVRGWSDPASINMTTRIDVPLGGKALQINQPTFIAGVAFSGNKGISQVEVSLDQGKSWQVATLKHPLSDLTWVLWELPWRPASGSHTIIARAIDMEGNVQVPTIAPPLPDGSTGYHTVSVVAS